MNKYLIKIFTKHLQTQFEIESDKEINNADELNKPIIDFLGKSDIKWEQSYKWLRTTWYCSRRN
jgi:hypothetical protein